MNLRNSGTVHYINAIKGRSVLKIRNVNSRALVLKNLKHIYEAECAIHLHVPVKKELPVTSEREHQVNISDHGGNIDAIASGGEMTLKQLRNRCNTKKRNKLEFLQHEDDCDLTTPLSSWNVKLSKTAKSQNKRAKTSANCTPMAIQVGVSPICSSQLQCASLVTEAGYAASSSDDQVNLSDMDSTKFRQTSDTTLENEQVILLAGHYETCLLNEDSYCQLDDDFMPISSLPPLSCNTQGPSTQDTGQHPSVSELQKIEAELMLSPSIQSLIISSQSSSDMPEISGHGTGDQASNVPLKNCTEIVYGSELCILEDNARTNSNMFNSYHYCFSMPQICNNESECLVSNVENDNSPWRTKTGGGIKLSVSKVIKSNMHQNLPDISLTSLFFNYSSPWNCYPCSASDSYLVTPEYDSPMIDDNRSLISYNSHTARNCLEPKFYPTCLEDSPYANEEKQALLPVNTDAEISFSSNAVNQLSNPEANNHYDMVLWQPPAERYPSMRKVISPASQEKLCLAMSSMELYDDIDNYKCKGKLVFGNQTEDSTLSAASDTVGGESYMTDESSGKVTLTKAILDPKKILKKPKRNKKGSPPKRSSSPKGHIEGLTKKRSPPKGRLESPHLARTLPGLCSGRTSIEVCRESVVAFSQRQLQDFESIAVKLMTELKSMKDIVEQKFLNEADCSTSMKNDADEVKSAIRNAARVEETTKKCLSMMARDCKRFCKIMSQPQRSTEDMATSTENMMHRKKKRISFADEAGGVLCHVKYFKNHKKNTGVTS